MSMARLSGGPADGSEVKVGSPDPVWAYVALNGDGTRAQPGEPVAALAVYRRDPDSGAYTFERTSERASA